MRHQATLIAPKQKYSRIWLVFIVAHILIISASNYLVQIPISIFSFATNWGTFSFPLIFLCSDLATRIYGAHQARIIVLYSMFPALIASYLISVLFVDGQLLGFEALEQFNSFVFRIALASFLAYLIGQLLDISIFSFLKNLSIWFIAPTISTIFGSLVDTFSFYAIAFYQSTDPYMSEFWLEMAWFDYGFKLIISLVIFIPIYGILSNQLVRFLSQQKNI